MSRSAASTLLLALALPALAQQSPKDVEMLNKHAGTWAADCAKPGTRLTVSVDALTLEAAGHERRVGAPITAFSYFGQQQPPKDFEAALLGDAANAQLVFFAMSDPSGPYLTVEADGPTLKLFGKPALAGKFRHCR